MLESSISEYTSAWPAAQGSVQARRLKVAKLGDNGEAEITVPRTPMYEPSRSKSDRTELQGIHYAQFSDESYRLLPETTIS